MALEAVVFSQPQAAAGHFGYGRGDSTTYAVPWCDLLQGGVGGGGGGFGDLCAAGEWDLDIDTWAAAAPTVELGGDDWDWEALSRDYQSSDASTEYHGGSRKAAAAPEPAGRRKRRRAKAVKNKEEIESQRMTHIAVERNRRRQMNEYLAVLRSLMPPSYAHRGDQASIVGGAINYVRELEQLLQSLEVQKSIRSRPGAGAAADSSPFAGFFSFPQYSATTSAHGGCSGNSNNTGSGGNRSDAAGAAAGAGAAGSAVADVEVTMVEGHASLKVLARRRPKQLLKLVAGLHQLRIPPLHLNVTTVDAMVLYTFSLKVEDDSNMGSVEDIAAAVHEIIGSIEQQQQEEGETAVM